MKKLAAQRWLLAIGVSVLTWCSTLDAAQLQGKVLDVVDVKKVSIRLMGAQMPNVGDSVKLGFMAHGQGFKAFQGDWIVSEVEDEMIIATPKDDTSLSIPVFDYLAIIETDD